MSKKTERKNKTNVVVKWPTTPLFFIQDIFDLNPAEKKITLRVRLINEIEANRVGEIGCKPGGQGRPPKVFAFTPIPESTWDIARSQNISLVEQSKRVKLSTIPAVSCVSPAKPQPVMA